jgi:hypothetical protein
MLDACLIRPQLLHTGPWLDLLRLLEMGEAEKEKNHELASRRERDARNNVIARQGASRGQ